MLVTDLPEWKEFPLPLPEGCSVHRGTIEGGREVVALYDAKHDRHVASTPSDYVGNYQLLIDAIQYERKIRGE